MPGRCIGCYHWVPPDGGRAKIGRCKRDNAAVHPGYGCEWHHPTMAAVQTMLDLTAADIAGLRTDTGLEAEALRTAWRTVWHDPADGHVRAVFARHLRIWRAAHA